MTVIAWDGKTLAADKRASTSWGAHDTVTKIERHGRFLLALAGDASVAMRIAAWWKEGALVREFPTEPTKDDAATFIVISHERGVQQYTKGPFPMRVEQGACSWGAGRDFAQAAMHLGKSAREAVEVACLLSTGCGNGIDTLELEP